MVMEVVHEDIGEDDSMQCANHPYRNSSPGGICAFCLQEKLGKLVSSPYASSVFPSSSSDSSSRSADAGGGATSQHDFKPIGYRTRKLMPFALTNSNKMKKTRDGATMTMMMNGSDSILKRSKSTANPTRRGNSNNNNNNNDDIRDLLDENCNYSPNRRGFWSFFHSSSSSSSKHQTPKKGDVSFKDSNFNASAAVGSSSSSFSSSAATVTTSTKRVDDDEFVAVDFESKVSRSRSVGCGSRRLSGDFFERISTGFGDCTLRRVESQREGGSGSKPKVQPVLPKNVHSDNDCIGERVKCGGIFSGFMMTPVEESDNNVSVKSKMLGIWAFASPMRAFGKGSNGKRGVDNNNYNKNSNQKSSSKNGASPNLDAIPSLLAVSG